MPVGVSRPLTNANLYQTTYRTTNARPATGAATPSPNLPPLKGQRIPGTGAAVTPVGNPRRRGYASKARGTLPTG